MGGAGDPSQQQRWMFPELKAQAPPAMLSLEDAMDKALEAPVSGGARNLAMMWKGGRNEKYLKSTAGVVGAAGELAYVSMFGGEVVGLGNGYDVKHGDRLIECKTGRLAAGGRESRFPRVYWSGINESACWTHLFLVGVLPGEFIAALVPRGEHPKLGHDVGKLGGSVKAGHGSENNAMMSVTVHCLPLWFRLHRVGHESGPV